ncbi:MAG: helix-turn-helix domain-containing protein [Mesorhizobium sp.]
MLQPPLANHVLFRTRDLDFARESVAQKFCRHRLDIVGERHLFNASHHHVAGSMISLNYISYGADVLIDPGELGDFYLVQIPVCGAAAIHNGRRQFVSDGGSASLLNPHWATRMRWWPGCAQVLVQIRKEPFLEYAQRLLCRSLAAPISFDPRIDLSRPEMQRWRSHVMALVRRAEAGSNPAGLTRALCEHQLVEDLLRLQPHDMSEFLEEKPASVPPRYLRRAVDFMRANAAEPLCVADLADVAGVSPRTLQLAWKAAYGASPMQALAQERLRRARHDLRYSLQAPVAGTAAKRGFTHLGRFSAATTKCSASFHATRCESGNVNPCRRKCPRFRATS